MKNEHCEDHCKLNETVARIDENVQFIKERKTELKWMITTGIAVMGLIVSIYAK